MKLSKKQTIILSITIIFFIISSGVIYILYTSQENSDNIKPTKQIVIEKNEDTIESDDDEIKDYAVYVCGQVKQAGVYTLPKGSRVIDAVVLAGGFTDLADELAVNLAKIIKDEQMIFIPSVIETVDKSYENIQNKDASENKQLLNINTASKEELKTIAGIGEVIAQNIIEYREEKGEFEDIEDIKNVTRIGEKTFESIKNKIAVE